MLDRAHIIYRFEFWTACGRSPTLRLVNRADVQAMSLRGRSTSSRGRDADGRTDPNINGERPLALGRRNVEQEGLL